MSDTMKSSIVEETALSGIPRSNIRGSPQKHNRLCRMQASIHGDILFTRYHYVPVTLSTLFEVEAQSHSLCRERGGLWGAASHRQAA